MEPREQRSGMRDDNTSSGGQWDDPMSKGSQGKWEQRGGELFAQAFVAAVHPCVHYHPTPS